MKTKIFLFGVIMLSMIACDESDFLNLKDPNHDIDANFWISEKNALSAMATIYSPIRSQMYGYYGAFTGFQNMNVRADDTWSIPDDPETWKIANFINTSNTDRSVFFELYKAINRANVFLQNIGQVPMQENEKDTLIAEAKFLRGFNYFLIVTNYGEAPLRLREHLTDDVMAPSVSEAELWKQVETDLTDAIKYLPVSRPKSEFGRVCKGAAIAYLGKSYLFQKKYAESKAELEIIMQAPYTYDLVVEYEDNFTTANEFNQESIFEINYAKFGTGTWGDEESTATQGWVVPTFIAPPLTGGWFKMMPTASLVEEFMLEERPAGLDSRFDKRMYTALYFKYSDANDSKADEKWYGNRYDMDTLWNSTKGKRALGAPAFPQVNGKEGRFLIKKYTNFWVNSKNGDDMYNPEPMDNNLRVMRFSEVLLLHAEASARTGDFAAANTDINRIRRRAGLPDKNQGSEADLMKEIEHQCQLEFFFEGHRFFDLKRWYTAEEMKDILVRNQKQGAENFQQKHFVIPIPQGELDTNTEIRQHPWW